MILTEIMASFVTKNKKKKQEIEWLCGLTSFPHDTKSGRKISLHHNNNSKVKESLKNRFHFTFVDKRGSSFVGIESTC